MVSDGPLSAFCDWPVYSHPPCFCTKRVKHASPTSELAGPILALTRCKDWLEFLHWDFLLVAIFIGDGSCLGFIQKERCKLQTS